MLANNYIEAWLLTFGEEVPEKAAANLHLRRSFGLRCCHIRLQCGHATATHDLHCLQACTPLLLLP